MAYPVGELLLMPRTLLIMRPPGNEALAPTLVVFVVVRIIIWFGPNEGTLSELLRLVEKSLTVEAVPLDFKYLSWKLFCSVYVTAGDARVEQFQN